ncbi:MAG: site-specific DNA-methyltransferase, partial [Chloroflexi bacterium]|nr:site-specific DNA-methyltransferase [Chloroflexota bacterium]
VHGPERVPVDEGGLGRPGQVQEEGDGDVRLRRPTAQGVHPVVEDPRWIKRQRATEGVCAASTIIAGKMPAPAEWVTVRRIRVKDSVNCLWWLSKTPNPKADNRRVLVEYSDDMRRLIARWYKAKQRPSGHNITKKWGKDQGGAICSNLLQYGNNDANGDYLKRCAEVGMKPHPARFPPQLPEFFLKYLTDPGDLVLDIFGGSNTTGFVAEQMERRWLTFELERKYLEASRLRFLGDLAPPRAGHPAEDGEGIMKAKPKKRRPLRDRANSGQRQLPLQV